MSFRIFVSLESTVAMFLLSLYILSNSWSIWLKSLLFKVPNKVWEMDILETLFWYLFVCLIVSLEYFFVS